MANILSFRLLNYFQSHSRKTKLKQQYLANRPSTNGYKQQDAGFSLIELIVVLLLVGILAAIAAPGWAAFVNRQRINKFNDAVFAALQEAQREAKNKKLSYSVSFRKNSTTQEVAIYRTDIGISTWKPLGTDVGVSSDKFLLGTNLNSTTENTADSTVSYSLNASAKITFDYMGTLPNASLGTSGLQIVVAVPSSANPTSPSSVKRCVIVKTLLGSMVTAKDNNCS
ncbi:prepilin-type N-terminal cleavage/methylation domain-containing protein [Nostoc sp. DSM 114167]|jgi:prepilin-type N-terminal cleavage/methylation domain-containing protein|uniref:prepilin-type N-terminal cleavage/methylation domain-containing protein n=1 Tax=Nostoc sp. DSM 114167 TaxID=3439050 RepID=UPI004046015C